MRRKRWTLGLLVTLLASVGLYYSFDFPGEQSAMKQAGVLVMPEQRVEVDTFQMVDSIRSRLIPYAIYRPVVKKGKINPIQLIIFSHGYGSNYPKNYLNYSYLTSFLAKKGYWVLSIQHELKDDPPLPQGGNIYERRMPIWKRGAENILAVLTEFKRSNPNIQVESVSLVGHSNGGDMSIWVSKENNVFKRVITLDHLRVPIPRTNQPFYASLRSTDKQADPEVLPDLKTCDSLGIRIIQLKGITHNQMNDEATIKQRKQIRTIVLELLKKDY